MRLPAAFLILLSPGWACLSANHQERATVAEVQEVDCDPVDALERYDPFDMVVRTPQGKVVVRDHSCWESQVVLQVMFPNEAWKRILGKPATYSPPVAQRAVDPTCHNRVLFLELLGELEGNLPRATLTGMVVDDPDPQIRSLAAIMVCARNRFLTTSYLEKLKDDPGLSALARAWIGFTLEQDHAFQDLRAGMVKALDRLEDNPKELLYALGSMSYLKNLHSPDVFAILFDQFSNKNSLVRHAALCLVNWLSEGRPAEKEEHSLVHVGQGDLLKADLATWFLKSRERLTWDASASRYRFK